MSAWDFSVAEAGIVAKLKQDLQAGAGRWARAIGTRKELAAVTEEMQMAPAVYVVYDGFAVIAGSEFEATLSHRWFVVLAVATAASQREAAPLNDEAGPYLADIWTALHGYTPPECRSPFVPATPPKPYFSDAKFAYYPLAFTTESYHCVNKPF